jgi:hypothetical protein
VKIREILAKKILCLIAEGEVLNFTKITAEAGSTKGATSF